MCFTLLLNPSRVLSFHCSFHHFFIYFIISLFISSYANAHGHLVCLTLLLNRFRLHHFITYILGSLTFKRMLDLWVYNYKPWSFIHSLSKWFIFIQDYVVQDLCILYVCQDLDVDLSRQHYSWIFNSRMTYVYT